MKICIATGTRAEYGLLKPLIDSIRRQQPQWKLQLLVTGAHLSPEFGLTYRQIEADGLHIDAKVEMLLSSDTPEGIVKSMGLGMIGYADAFKNLSPDLLVVLGDRYEMLAVVSAALIYRIPVAHLYGGEITEGAFDDAIRHAITKMSHYHFTSTEAYRQRVIQMGEPADHVFNVGAIGLDNIRNLPLMDRGELARNLNLELDRPILLITFHPATWSETSASGQFQELLQALDQFSGHSLVFTRANADTEGRDINAMMDQYVRNRPHARAFASLGQLRYLSLMRLAQAVVGNSSSGILEAPAFGVPTVNIGDRQKGRIRPDSILDCPVERGAIAQTISLACSERFRNSILHQQNPYGDGTAALRITEALGNVLQKRNNIYKKFQDVY